MTTKQKSIRQTGGLGRAGGVLAAILFAAIAQAQPQIATVISSGLFEPNSVTHDPNNIIYFTDSSHNRIVEFVSSSNGVFTLAGSGTYQAGFNDSGFGDQALFAQPLGIVYDPIRAGLVVVDQANQVLRLVTLAGAVSTLTGIPATPANPDGGFTDGFTNTAQFSYPTGIATDNAGNLYVADTGNSAIRCVNSTNGVTTLVVTNYTFYLPEAVAVDSCSNLWVADTGNDTLCIISNISVLTNQSVHVIAGTVGRTGTNDAANAANALFNKPGGLLWDPNGAGLFISDTGNDTVRRLYTNTAQSGFSVQTVAGIPKSPGNTDGVISAAQFNSPIGMIEDAIDNGYYIADRGNNELRRYQTGPPLPPVGTPQIGLVSFPVNVSTGTPASVFTALPYGGIFYTNNIITIYNTDSDPNIQTYYTVIPTPVNPFAAVPVITTNSLFAPNYTGNGSAPTAQNSTTLLPLPLPYEVTMYAQSFAKGRPPSPVVSANFSYITAPPGIVGNNGASVLLTELTSPATLWYTLDGNPPVINGDGSFGPVPSGTNISFSVDSNITLMVQAFSPGFAPSPVVSEVFAASNFVANQITFGFASGEASSRFVGSAGHRYYVPVTLTPLAGATMYALQFNITITNLNGAPAPGQNYTFQSDLLKLLPDNSFGLIPPAAWNGASLQTLLFTNSASDLLGVGWMEITVDPRATNLYNPAIQDLITYSMVHETLFNKSGGQVVLGNYSFDIPANAAVGQQYQVQINRPSADGDGFTQNVLVQAPTNGSPGPGAISAIKNITVGVVPYLVGDAAPFRWWNAGDFGDSHILNNDVLEIFRCAAYHDNIPPAGSDFYDALDSSDGTDNHYYDGNDTLINNMKFGDGKLDVSDLYVTFRRSLDPSLNWYERFWSNNGAGGVALFAQAVPNLYKPLVLSKPLGLTKPLVLADPAMRPLAQSAGPGSPRYITVAADTVQAGGSLTVQVPVRVLAADSLPIRVLAMNVDIVPLDGSPAITTPVTFSPAAGLGSPYTAMSQSANNYAAAWLDSTVTGVSGTSVIGTVTVTLPANVSLNSSYLVHFEHFSASPNGLATFQSTIQDGLITVGNRTGSSWGDGIPDTWRLIYFGAISNLLSAADLDADGDGASNWQEYVAGTNPMDPTSVLTLTPVAPAPNFSLQWPSVPGKTYMVQSAVSLFSTNWTIMASNLPGTGQLMQLSDPNLPAPPGRFYRVQVQ